MEKNNKNLNNKVFGLNMINEFENNGEDEAISYGNNDVKSSSQEQSNAQYLQTDPPQDPKPILKNFGFDYPIMIIPDGSPPKGFYVVPIH